MTPTQREASLQWESAPQKTQWGGGMVEALVELDKDSTLRMYCHEDDVCKVRDALLRELAAEPAQEPVAWGQLGTLNGHTYLREKYDRSPYPPPADIVRNLNLVPLYAAPQQRTPLSDEVVAKLINDEWATPDVPSAWKFARAIERAHGITGEPT